MTSSIIIHVIKDDELRIRTQSGRMEGIDKATGLLPNIG